MQLTGEQQQALEQGAAVDIILDGQPCVVLSREASERLTEEYDTEPWTKEEMD